MEIRCVLYSFCVVTFRVMTIPIKGWPCGHWAHSSLHPLRSDGWRLSVPGQVGSTLLFSMKKFGKWNRLSLIFKITGSRFLRKLRKIRSQGRADKMTHWLRALAALTGDPDSVLSTYAAAHKLLWFQFQCIPQPLLRQCTHMVHMYTHRKSTHPHKIKINLFLKRQTH